MDLQTGTSFERLIVQRKIKRLPYKEKSPKLIKNSKTMCSNVVCKFRKFNYPNSTGCKIFQIYITIDLKI